MKAERLLHQRQWISQNGLIEMKVWRVSCPVLPCDHEYKYSLVYIRDGQRVIGFDNEQGKMDDMLYLGSVRNAEQGTPANARASHG